MNKLSKLSMVAATCAFITTSAQAATFTQTETFGTATPDFTEVLTFDQLANVAIADIISVQIILENSISGGILTVDNDGVNPASVNLTLGAETSISSSDLTLLDGSFDPVVADLQTVNQNLGVALASNDSDIAGQFDNDNGPDNFTLTGGNVSLDDDGFINSLFYSEYLGNGTFDLTVDSDTEFSIDGASGVAGSFVPVESGGSVTVIIEYDDSNAIPEPSTYAALLGLVAVAGTLVIRRRANA